MTADSENIKQEDPDRVDDSQAVLEAFRLAVREAVWEHKLAGNPVATWRDGKVHWVQPDEIKGPPPGRYAKGQDHDRP